MSEYTREAGVRNLERELGTILRKTATKVASGKAEAPVEIDLELVRDALGRQKVFQEAALRTAVPGVATGLAVTGTGGDVLFVEATSMEGKDGLVLTGQLGDVMKESAQIALSYVRGHADELGIDPATFHDREFHVHIPAGAIPKDGPSAGITMTTALASLLSGRPIKHTVGMTGEVTLQGRVLPIGGLKQKVLAAHAAGLTDVILPERNRGDLDDVPEDVREQMTVPPGDEHRRGARAGPRAGPHRGGRLEVTVATDGDRRGSKGRPDEGPGMALRIVALFRPYRGRLAAVLALIALSAGLGIISPFLLRDVLDVAIPENNDGLLALLVAGMIAISVVTGVLGVGQTWLSNVVGQKVMHDLRAQVYRHLQRLSASRSSRARARARSSRGSPTTSAACRTSSPAPRRRSSPTSPR